MPVNQFVPFATGVGANTLTPAAYAARGEISQGTQAGTAPSILFNSIWRQSTSVAAMVAQFIADHQSGDVLDNGNIAALEIQFQAAMQSVAGTTRLSFGQDTGAADTLVVATTPTFTALSAGQIIIVTKGGAANTTGTPTVAFNGLTPVRIYKPSGAAVLAGDLPANTELMLGVDPNGILRLLSTGLSISDITAIAASVVSSNILGDGQCRLSVLNTTTLKLSPFAGSSLIINGVYQALPTAGITCQITGPSPNTLYYVYAYMNGGTMALEAVTTGYTTDSLGRNNKTNDTTRRLIGAVYTNSASQFADTPTWRGCSNFFNRQDTPIDTGQVTGQSATVGTNYPISAAIPFYAWPNSRVNFSAFSLTNTGSVYTAGNIYIDGSYAGYNTVLVPGPAGGATNGSPLNAGVADLILAEGIHTVQGIVGSVLSSGGTGGAYTISSARQFGYIRG